MLEKQIVSVSDKYAFMGCYVDCLTRQATRERIVELMMSGQTPLTHAVINAGKVASYHADAALREAIAAADIVSADGQAIVWFGRLSGVPIPERVTGIDLMSDLLEEANRYAWRVYLLGGTEAVVHQTLQHIQARYPGLGALAGRNGYFAADEEEAICDSMAAWHPDIVFLGMNTPKKELLAYTQLHRMGSKLVMGVGGAFDVWAGTTRRAPVILQRFGLEWFFRFLQEPLRMWRRYIFGNVRFLYLWGLWIKNGRPQEWGDK